MIIYIISKCFQYIEFQKFLSVYYYYYIYDYIYSIQMFPTVHIFQKSVTSPRQTEHPVSALDLGLNVATAFLGVLVFVYGLQGSLETLWKEMGCP